MALQLIVQKWNEAAKRPGFVLYHNDKLTGNVADIATLFKKLPAIMEQIPEAERENLFYTLAHHAGAGEDARAVRNNSTFMYQTVLGFDVDYVDADRVWDYVEIFANFLACPKESLIVVTTGNGLHVLVNLKQPIRHAKYFEDHKLAYKEVIYKIQKRIIEKNLPGKADTKVFDAARIFRLPYTRNVKPNKDPATVEAQPLIVKECKLVQYSDSAIEVDLMEISGLKALGTENVSPSEIKKNYPFPDLPEMVKECRFMDWAITKPTEVHEPNFFDFASLLACQPENSTVLIGEQELSPKMLAKKVFDGANDSASLAKSSFEEKWEQAGRYGGRKCSTIDGVWDSPGCKSCPHFGKIPTPLALKSKDHIGSAANGYWVLTQKGFYSYPHYEDLSKVYYSEHKQVILKGERIFGFNGEFYQEVEPLQVKSWLEKKVLPTEPVREMHRNEFLHKVKSVGALTTQQEENLFTRSIKGKLNCANGVLDIMSGELLPNHGTYGFKYVLPYGYDESARSEYFLDWLETVTMSRSELMECILDVMGYMLWPNYDDHLFCFLTGVGNNGKSTLIDVMRAIVGDQNYSSVNVEQLGKNRFAPAALEGKLVNLSEESSGVTLDYNEMNVIKNLSAGGTMQIERKGVQGYSYTNFAKLIFSANNMPRFQETGLAVKRRLLAIPFDYKIETPDSRIGSRLIQEIPGILGLLIERIRENVTRNGGRYVVSRGGTHAAAAQREVLTAGNSVVEWAKENIDSGTHLESGQYVGTAEAYARYKEWAEMNSYRPVNVNNFGKAMTEFVVTRAAGGTTTFRAPGAQEVKRVYKYTRFILEGAQV